MESSKISLSDIPTSNIFSEIVRNHHTLPFFLNFCSSDGNIKWSKCLTFWLEVEQHRQLVGERNNLQKSAAKLWDEYLCKNEDVTEIVPKNELFRLSKICERPEQVELDTFSCAQAHVQLHLTRNAVPAFLASTTHASMVEEARLMVDGSDGGSGGGSSGEVGGVGHVGGGGPGVVGMSSIQSHLLEVLKDKTMCPYLEAYVANYRPEHLATMKMWTTIVKDLEPVVLYVSSPLFLVDFSSTLCLLFL